MRIAFTGHRDKQAWVADLVEIALKYPKALWVHGGAEGFDAQVERYANLADIPTKIIRPDYKRYHGKKAPLMRNHQIVRGADLLVALYDGRKGGGTRYTMDIARDNDIPIIELKPRQGKEIDEHRR